MNATETGRRKCDSYLDCKFRECCVRLVLPEVVAVVVVVVVVAAAVIVVAIVVVAVAVVVEQ